MLEAYLEALVAGDCTTTRALSTDAGRQGNGDLCGGVRVSAYRIAGEPATPNDHEVVFGTTVQTTGGDVSLPDGPHTWFYDLVRQPDGAWRIAGGGSGP